LKNVGQGLLSMEAADVVNSDGCSYGGSGAVVLLFIATILGKYGVGLAMSYG